jgi:hypothetical protein
MDRGLTSNISGHDDSLRQRHYLGFEPVNQTSPFTQETDESISTENFTADVVGHPHRRSGDHLK